MISKYNHKDVNWTDLESPKKEEIEHIIEQYPIPSTIKERLLSKQIKDQIDINDDYIYISVNNNLTLFVNDTLVLSIHNGQGNAMSRLSKELELDMVAGEKIHNNKILFAHLLKNLHINSQNQLIDKDKEIQIIKKVILKQNKRIKTLNLFIILLIIISVIFIWL